MTRETKAERVQQEWANLAVEELIRCGVDYFCLAPGSRSTPLALAVAANPRSRHCVHFDERSLAFHALGYAAARHGGVALMTTSGTAVANMLPAVIEAAKKKLPLVIISADRPLELRQTGANQTISQPGIFGHYVRWEVDFGVATADVDPAFVLTTIDQAVFRSQGELPGPVHINWMFREPFATSADKDREAEYCHAALKRWNKSNAPWTTYFKPQTAPDPLAVRSVGEEINTVNNGIIVVGKLSGPEAARNVIRLAEKLQWPIFADVTSGLRFSNKSPSLISHFDQILEHISVCPDLILHLGGRMTSKRYYHWINQVRPATYIMVLNHPLRNDPGHQVSHRVQSCPGAFAQKVAAIIPQRKSGKVLRECRLQDDKIRAFLTKCFADQTELSEPAVVSRLSLLIPKTNALFLGNSLPIREFDMFADHRAAQIPVSANRGASGIDGIISSAAGFSQGLDKSVTLLIGDLAFLYDLNALSIVSRLDRPMIIIVFNNDGGGIFEFLPVAKNAESFEEFFAAPHGYRFQDSARQFQLEYVQPTSPGEFEMAYRAALGRQQSTLIEILIDRKANLGEHQRITNKIKGLLKKQ